MLGRIFSDVFRVLCAEPTRLARVRSVSFAERSDGLGALAQPKKFYCAQTPMARQVTTDSCFLFGSKQARDCTVMCEKTIYAVEQLQELTKS
jgi:hypothetical protein